jgi:hypothetical protein
MFLLKLATKLMQEFQVIAIRYSYSGKSWLVRDLGTSRNSAQDILTRLRREPLCFLPDSDLLNLNAATVLVIAGSRIGSLRVI